MNQNVFAGFDEIPSKTFPDTCIKETNVTGRTDAWTAAQTDVKTVYPSTNTVCGRYKYKFMTQLRANKIWHEIPPIICECLKELTIFVCLFGLRLYVPVNNFSVMSGRSHRFLGITSTFWEVNVSCSWIQHGDLSED